MHRADLFDDEEQLEKFLSRIQSLVKKQQYSIALEMLIKQIAPDEMRELVQELEEEFLSGAFNEIGPQGSAQIKVKLQEALNKGDRLEIARFLIRMPQNINHYKAAFEKNAEKTEKIKLPKQATSPIRERIPYHDTIPDQLAYVHRSASAPSAPIRIDTQREVKRVVESPIKAITGPAPMVADEFEEEEPTEVLEMPYHEPSREGLNAMVAEVFSKKDPRLRAWLDGIIKDYQVPTSVYTLKAILTQRFQVEFDRLPQNYRRKLNRDDYVNQKVITAIAKEQKEKEFGNLIEYIYLDLLQNPEYLRACIRAFEDHNHVKFDLKIVRTLHASPEEDKVFQADLVQEYESSDGSRYWASIDVTTNPYALASKRQMADSRGQHILKNLAEYVKGDRNKKGELRYPTPERTALRTSVVLLDEEVFSVVAHQYLTEIKNGTIDPQNKRDRQKKLYEIFLKRCDDLARQKRVEPAQMRARTIQRATGLSD